jgi:hypothetical protein
MSWFLLQYGGIPIYLPPPSRTDELLNRIDEGLDWLESPKDSPFAVFICITMGGYNGFAVGG